MCLICSAKMLCRYKTHFFKMKGLTLIHHPSRMGTGRNAQRSCIQCQQKALPTFMQPSTAFHITVCSDISVANTTQARNLPYLFTIWVSASLPPRFSMGSESQVDSLIPTLVHTCSSCFPFPIRVLFGLQKVKTLEKCWEMKEIQKQKHQERKTKIFINITVSKG